MSDLERIAYESAVWALDKQEKVLEELRARTGILLGASSLVVSLLGGTALGGPGSVLLLGLALAAFVVSLGASLYILLPREGFVFALNGPEVYEELYEFRDDVAEVHRRLAYNLQGFWDRNECVSHQFGERFALRRTRSPSRSSRCSRWPAIRYEESNVRQAHAPAAPAAHTEHRPSRGSRRRHARPLNQRVKRRSAPIGR